MSYHSAHCFIWLEHINHSGKSTQTCWDRPHLWLPHYVASVLVKPWPVRNSLLSFSKRVSLVQLFPSAAVAAAGWECNSALGVLQLLHICQCVRCFRWPLLPTEMQSICMAAHVCAHELQMQITHDRDVLPSVTFSSFVAATDDYYHYWSCYRPFYGQIIWFNV